MKTEESAGIIVFREEGRQVFYLLLQDDSGNWGFPKGKPQSEETFEETALRETREESGLKKIEIIPSFKEEIHYFFQREEKVSKRVLFFLGKTAQKEIKLSFEHRAFQWLTYAQAQKKLGFENSRLLLKKAQAFLSSS
jgi:bis(5'-nucleosidyl)-tetraphosphatase